MHCLSTRVASTLLAFGIFFSLSCTSYKHTNPQEQPGTSNNQHSFDEQLAQLNEQIQNDANNGELQVQKAELLSNYARELSAPVLRRPMYQNLYDTAVEAQINAPSASNQIHSLLAEAWNFEQNAAVTLLQNSSSEIPANNYNLITAHLDNAITVAPDSVITYRLLANAQYSQGYYADAINTVESALSIIQDKEKETLFREKLAYLFLEAGMGTESIEMYHSLAEENPGLIQLQHGLVNALIINGHHQEAAAVLKNLAEEHPSRTSYKESLAAESYYHFIDRFDDLMNHSTSGITQPDINELLALLETSNAIYSTLQEQAPMNEELTFNAAVFYKNSAFRLSQLALSDPDTSRLHTTILEYRNAAMPYWERLAEINPDNMEYMFNLYELYISLEMTQEAQQLEQSYNF